MHTCSCLWVEIQTLQHVRVKLSGKAKTFPVKYINYGDALVLKSLLEPSTKEVPDSVHLNAFGENFPEMFFQIFHLKFSFQM